MSFTHGLRQENIDLWERTVSHPFVRELGDGTLSREAFRRYWLQDYLFIRSLVTAVSLAVARSPDFPSARRLAGFLSAVLGGEDDLFQRGFRHLGISREDAAGAEPLPAARAYSDFLVRVAHEGSFIELLTALCCSEWSYAEWAGRLASERKRPQDPVYREWIEIHATPDFVEFVSWMRGMLDSEAAAPHRDAMRVAFVTALRYEYAFFEMAYRGEKWLT